MKHKIIAGVVLVGGAYNLYYDYKEGNTTLDYIIDGAVFLAGVSLFF